MHDVIVFNPLIQAIFRFVEVLISTQMAETKGKEAVPNGFQNDAHLWAIFTSSRLNLKIPPDQVIFFYINYFESVVPGTLWILFLYLLYK